ncbi:homeobox protein MIXL1-like [Herpailurus yagouaroundi]|uniref:homeobox protein MIXL1-like n=1 Tax=Herpailurus yagouaroundi TaxID=1608482 RepID=UPI001AD6DD0F|nr:homeobox protein MIXL1-like [Puma yagouaroundi]
MQEPGSPEGAPGPAPGAGAEAGEASGPPEEAPSVGEGVPHQAVGTSWGRDRGPGARPPPVSSVRVALALDGRAGGPGEVGARLPGAAAWLGLGSSACLPSAAVGPPSARTLPRPRKKRTVYLKEQLQELERHFWANRYPSYQERVALAAGLNLDEHQVQVWFKNRRAKHSRLPKGRGRGASPAAPGGRGAGVPQCVPAPPPVLVPARVPEHAPVGVPVPAGPAFPGGPGACHPAPHSPRGGGRRPPRGRARHLQPERRPAGPAGLPGVRPGCTNPGSRPRPASGMLRLRHLARRRLRTSPQFHSGRLPPRPLGGIPFPLDGPVPGGRRPCRGHRLGLCY